MEKIISKLAKKPYKSILIGQLIIYILCSISFYNVIPYLLNYPPNSINTPFQLTINPTYYWVYYVLLCIICIFIVFIYSVYTLRTIKKIYKRDLSLDEKLLIRKKCTNFSIGRMLLFTTIFPCFIALLALLLLHTEFILTLKICLFVLIFLGIPNIVFYIYSNIILKEILKNIFDKEVFRKEHLSKTHLWKNIVLQILPTIAISILLLLMLFIANITTEIGNHKYNSYKEKLKNAMLNINPSDPIYIITDKLHNSLNDENWFIKVSEDNYIYSKTEISEFMKNYIEFYATDTNDRIYDSYGLTTQGIVETVTLNDQSILIGITYDTLPNNTVLLILLTSLFLILVDFGIIYMVSYILENDIKNITNNLLRISKFNTMKEELLPITSTDELSDLTTAFNNVQSNSLMLFSQVKETQDQLIEQERLASLGQMIGGIAHNLKTPIMSIAGAAEGIKDLVNEFDASIGNPVVNDDDFHDIAKDMYTWVDKIKDYTEYMSDVITAVKGQAVVLGNDNEINFTINELLKRVNILMKHELKNAVIYLNTSVKIDENTIINGDVNSLVQVINNMISNAIQAYGGKQEQNIDLIVDRYDEKHIAISVKDYGPGLPDTVKDKLFKEMVTTKGKNGTGLGLYMSYSNIKARFNGDIKVDSEKGKGTTFNIILPL